MAYSFDPNSKPTAFVSPARRMAKAIAEAEYKNAAPTTKPINKPSWKRTKAQRVRDSRMAVVNNQSRPSHAAKRVGREAVAANAERQRLRELQRHPSDLPKQPYIPRDEFAREHARLVTSPEWIERRHRIFKERGRRCESCGTTRGALQLHHLTYANFTNERDDELVILCGPCHEARHGR